MRALFVNSPGLGHIFPSVPLAHGLRAAGHDVLYAQGGDVDSVAAAGVDVVDVTPGTDYAKVFQPEDIDFTVDGGDDFLAQLFARVSGVTVDRVLEVARAWRPDLLINSPLQGAGAMAATMLNIPSATLILGPADCSPALAGLLREQMNDRYEAHGLTGRPREQVRLNSIPPSLLGAMPEELRSPGDWPVRYVPFNGNGQLPDWLLETPQRPRIAVTLGSIAGLWGGLAMLAPLVAAARDVDAEFVVTLGGGDPALLGDLPPNVRAVNWLALGALLPTCSALIHHGGSGTAMAGMSAGVPQCVMPLSPDQKVNLDALVARGIGIGADAATIGAAQFRALLEDGSMRKAAGEVRDEVAVMPSPADLVEHLVDLAK
ncbi:nucleotide disphospho-sugar-binding domain-containing protein [Micromonospora ureilytica]|uniref:nucleotide disphospho-sugar-binding domain-containing protein n=1 Tax=Micromonospora ureilytica TaxID=709868 RepID=UPI0033BFC342